MWLKIEINTRMTLTDTKEVVTGKITDKFTKELIGNTSLGWKCSPYIQVSDVLC